MMKSYQNKTKWQISQTIKKSCLILLILCGISMSGIAHAANHWSPEGTVKSFNVWEGAIFIFVNGSVINPASCGSNLSYVIAAESPIYDQLFKAILSATVAGLKVKIVVSDSIDSCSNDRPAIIAVNVVP